MKRCLSLLLAAVMLLSVLPMAATPLLGPAAKAAGSYNTGDIITFGGYPQAVVEDENLLAALDTQEKNWISYRYYSGTGDCDGNMQAGDWMRYADVIYNGAKYRAVVFDSYRPSACHNPTGADNSYQDNNRYETGRVYYFKYQSLRWRVLDPAAGLVLCEDIVDAQAFQNVVWSSGSYYYRQVNGHTLANDYASCTLRKWLNQEFINTAFSEKEQALLADTRLDSGDEAAGDTPVTDKLFPLSETEAQREDYGLGSSADRGADGTEYAKCQGLYYDDWWLRTPYTEYSYAQYISYVKVVSYGISRLFVDNTSVGIRPAFVFKSGITETKNPGGGGEHLPEKYDVTYDANGGTGAPAAQLKTEGEELKLSAVKPTRSYTLIYNANGGSVSADSKTLNVPFKHWNVKADGSGTAYAPGEVYRADANLALYARWTNPAAGALPVPTRYGYTFAGWFTAASGGTQITKDSVISKNTTIFAHWKAVPTPAVPQNLQAVVYGANGICLTWTESSGATQYNVYRYNGTKQDYVYIGTALKAAYYDGDRAAGVTYYYKVNAVRKSDGFTYVSDLSASASAKAVGVPAVPQNVKAAPYGEKGVRLTWTASSGATQYNVYRYNSAAGAYVYIGTATNAAYYDGSRVVGTTYYYRVKAVCKWGSSTWVSGYSEAASAKAVGTPAVPKNLKAAVYGNNGIRLSWTASPGATQYNIYRYNGAKKDYVYIGTAYKAAYYEGGLVPGVTYYYKVNAVCKTAVSTWVSGFPAAANAKAVGKPAAPKNLKAAPYGEKGVRLTWTASPGATSYYVYRYNGAEQQYVYIGAADKAAYYDGSRAVGVTYYYRVRAVCRIDGTAYIGDYSAAASAKAVGTPAVPQGLKAVPYNDNSIHLSWTASPGATQYNVYRYNGAKQAYVYIGTATGTAYRDGGLVPGATYYYKVNAVCKANGSTWVSGFPAAVSAKAVGAPVAPQNLKAAQYGESGIRLSWTASPGATGYRVYRYDEDEEGYVSIGATTKAAYYDGDLWGGVTYYYVVKAVHRTSAAAYESGWSSVAGAQVKPAEIFSHIPTEFWFSVGTVTYSAALDVYADGTFTGFNTSRYGVGFGNVIQSEFRGRFKNVKKIDDRTYSMQVASLTYDIAPGIVKYDEYGMKIEYTETDAMAVGDTVMLYLPGKASKNLPSYLVDMASYILKYNPSKPTNFYAFYNKRSGTPFWSD